MNLKNNNNMALEEGISIYIRSKNETATTSKDHWRKKKDIYAQNKQNDEYKTAPGQFCWHEKSLYELFVHD